MKLAIVYFSGSGNTRHMAEAVLAGARSVAGTETVIHAIEGRDIVEGRYTNEAVIADLDTADAMIFGAPTYMGGPAAQFKTFADATSGRWYTQAWSGKLAAGFTVSASPSGDKLNTLQYFNILAMQHGMIWAGLGQLPQLEPAGINRIGFYLGAAGQAAAAPPNALDLDTGRALGARIAALGLRLTTCPKEQA